jgi:predicted small lipoprotein YifL
MKAVMKFLWVVVVIALLAGCGSTSEEPVPAATTEPAEKETVEMKENTSKVEGEEADIPNGNDVPSEENEAVEPDSTTTDAGSLQEEDALSQYSSEQIEYARVWQQLGPKQDIEGLYVERIPAGTPLNPDDETSGTYPERVIQLAGSRLVDGSVTYSGNGDGTINVYNVPLRWDGEYPAGEEFYTEILDNAELVPFDVGEEAEVIRLIELLKEQP